MNMNKTSVFAIGLLVCCGTAYGQVSNSGPATRNVTTPKPATPVWETERDLLVLFENASDRVALAQQIATICLNTNSNLSTQQRYDGLSIAGHVLWGEMDLSSAISCFSGIIALNVDPDATADAYRMRAQCNFFNSDYANASNDYSMCYSISKNIESSDGYHDLYKIVSPMLIESAAKAGDDQLVITIAEEAFANTVMPSKFRVEALRSAGSAALGFDDFVNAQRYLSAVLNDYPAYGLGYPGERVSIELELIQANGHSLMFYSTESVDALAELIKRPEYQGLPVWVTAVSKMAKLLDQADNISEANELRLWAVDQVSVANNNLGTSPSATHKKRIGRLAQLGLLQAAARQYGKTRQYSSQEQVLLRIVNDFADLDQNAVAAANADLAQIAIIQSAP